MTLEKEVEGIDNGQLSYHLDLNTQFARLLRKDDARDVVRLRILLPVDEMLLRRHLHRVAENSRAAVWRRPQANGLRSERDRTVVAVASQMSEGHVYRHDKKASATELDLRVERRGEPRDKIV